jgi:hypothetical protein|tara:strand:- start:1536 stop:1685 length:150 start_codon:yes stop_codon:yes gene_type:complete
MLDKYKMSSLKDKIRGNNLTNRDLHAEIEKLDDKESAKVEPKKRKKRTR